MFDGTLYEGRIQPSCVQWPRGRLRSVCRGIEPGQDQVSSPTGTEMFSQVCVRVGNKRRTQPSSGQGPIQAQECLSGVCTRVGSSLIECREQQVGSGVLLRA